MRPFLAWQKERKIGKKKETKKERQKEKSKRREERKQIETRNKERKKFQFKAIYISLPCLKIKQTDRQTEIKKERKEKGQKIKAFHAEQCHVRPWHSSLDKKRTNKTCPVTLASISSHTGLLNVQPQIPSLKTNTQKA